ncbi:hypothetical protein H1R20_g12073, partial [Candolleomyces eurysporus]
MESKQGTQQRLPVAIPELQERVASLRLSIQNDENTIRTIQIEGGPGGEQLPPNQQERVLQFQGAIDTKKFLLLELLNALNAQPESPRP